MIFKLIAVKTKIADNRGYQVHHQKRTLYYGRPAGGHIANCSSAHSTVWPCAWAFINVSTGSFYSSAQKTMAESAPNGWVDLMLRNLQQLGLSINHAENLIQDHANYRSLGL